MSATAATHRPPSSRTPLRRHVRRAAGRDRSPLCRPLDRAYSRLVTALALTMLGVLAVAAATALLVQRAETRTAELAALHRHVVTAVTTGPAVQDDPRSGGTRAHAPARWSYPAGPGTGNILAPVGAAAGTAVPVGLNDAGQPTGAPKPADLILSDAVLVGLGTVTVLGFATEGAAALRRRVLDRRAEAGWEAAWERIEPQWSGRR